MSLDPIFIICARMKSTRLPGKPLASIAGVSMLKRMWDICMKGAQGAPVAITTPDEVIMEYCRKEGMKSYLTGLCDSGTDQVYMALEKLDRQYDVVVNVQGDMPDLDPANLGRVVRAYEEGYARGNEVASLVCPADFRDAQLSQSVKAVLGRYYNANNVPVESVARAIYFSRQPIPWGEGPFYHHVGIYAYSYGAIDTFYNLPRPELEKREKLEQLRFLDRGMPIAVGFTDTCPHSVDTAEDLLHVRALFHDTDVSMPLLDPVL